MLELKDITLSFDNISILQNTNCSVEKEDFIVIVGANGAGKSTLFDIIAGRTQPTTGSIYLDGMDITNLKETRRARFVSRLLQNTDLNTFASLSVEANLALATYRGRKVTFKNGMSAFPRHVVKEVLRPLEVDLEPLLKRPLGSLSLGQRQIISFVMATLVPPKILLLDEPTAGLDPTSATTLIRFATKFINTHPITTLLITHDPKLALSIGNKLWIMNEGVITHRYSQEEKALLSPDTLIGEIDYEKIALENALR